MSNAQRSLLVGTWPVLEAVNIFRHIFGGREGKFAEC